MDNFQPINLQTAERVHHGPKSFAQNSFPTIWDGLCITTNTGLIKAKT